MTGLVLGIYIRVGFLLLLVSPVHLSVNNFNFVGCEHWTTSSGNHVYIPLIFPKFSDGSLNSMRFDNIIY